MQSQPNRIPISSFLAQADPAMLGTGGANRAGNAMADRQSYLKYVEEQQMNGLPALPYPEWMKMMQNGKTTS